MPAKPVWIDRLDQILQELRALPRPYVDRSTIEFLLGVGRRRAQQILSPCVDQHVGASGLADRDRVIEHLRRLAVNQESYYELRRRRKVAEALAQLRAERLNQPRLLIEAPLAVVSQEFENLPRGVRIEAGRITVEFDEPREALEKLLALAMAIGNDFSRFERATRR